MKKILIFLAALISFSIYAHAEDSSFINAQLKQINKVLEDNYSGPNDPKACFNADTKNKTLTLTFARNKPLAGMDKSIFENVASMLPTTMITIVYITSKSIENGFVVGSKFIKELQDSNYRVNVIISGTDTQYEFNYPSSILSIREK